MGTLVHKYASRTQAEKEAEEYAQRHYCRVAVIQLADGRYGNVVGALDHADTTSVIAQFMSFKRV